MNFKPCLLACFFAVFAALLITPALAGEQDLSIRLRNATFDPALGEPTTLSGFPDSAKSDSTGNLEIVQFTTPLGAQLDYLEKNGRKVLAYIPNNAYLIYVTEDAAKEFDMKARWSGEYRPSYKVDPELLAALASSPQTQAEKPYRIAVVVQIPNVAEGLAKQAAKDFQAEGATLINSGDVAKYTNFRLEIDLKKIPSLAALPYVIWIEREPERRLCGERECQIIAGDFDPTATCALGPGYRDWLNQFGLAGSGSIVHVADDGLDQGIDSNAPGTAHADIIGRIYKIDNLTTDAAGDSKAGHGQLNAGIIMANASLNITGKDDYLLGMGVIPDASVYASKIFKNNGNYSNYLTITGMMKKAREAGAQVSSNSWGAAVDGGYNTDSQEYDVLTRDAQPDVPGNQQMTFVFAAGNEGFKGSIPRPGSIDSPATGKNVLSAGASENCDADGMDGCSHPADSADNIRHVADFSSRGPTQDGRFGVTLMAPGTHVQGPASTVTGVDNTGVCGYWPTNQTNYVRSTGTSHSTPLVAGGAMLFSEKYAKDKGAAPSPAMVRAALVNGAVDMVGGLDTAAQTTLGTAPNFVQGWGQMNMQNVLSNQISHIYRDQDTLFTNPVDEYHLTIIAVDSARPLRITAAWTDAPAILSATQTLCNNLDLVVVQDDKQWLGNVLEDGFSVQGGSTDTLNNIECVYLDNPSGRYDIYVRVGSLVSDGVPGNEFNIDQDFALVVSNGTDQSSEGLIMLDKALYNCNSTATVRVSDLDLRGVESVTAEFFCALSGDKETVTLHEETAQSGILGGTISLRSGTLSSGDGILQVEDGATIEALYHDQDNGHGQTVEATETALIDCLEPLIHDVQLTNIGVDSVRIVWYTNEPSTSRVRFGDSCGQLAQDAAVMGVVYAHVVDLTGLDSCTSYAFQVESEDKAGNLATDNQDGSCYGFTTRRMDTLFEDILDPTPIPSWMHYAAAGDDLWQVIASDWVHTGTQSWFGKTTSTIQDDSLVMPPLDIYAGSVLTFWHSFVFEEDFDGGVLEISLDGGDTWSDLGQFILINGYNGMISEDYESPIAGRPAWTDGAELFSPVQVQVDLSAFAGVQRLIRFRLTSDSGNSEDWEGWYIDDVSVQTPAPCNTADGWIDLDKSLYACSSSAALTLSDTDLAGAGSWIVSVSSPLEATPELITLNETSTEGVFSGVVQLSGGQPVVSDGVLQIQDGATLSALYIDQRSALGEVNVPRTDYASADCQTPKISGVVIENVQDTAATIRWQTDEEANSVVLYGLSPQNLDMQAKSDFLRTNHHVQLAGLTGCATFYFEVRSTDQAGNLAVDNNAGLTYTIETRRLGTVFQDLIDPQPLPGWMHGSVIEPTDDDWAVVDITPEYSHSGGKAWFVSNPDYRKDSWLVLPPFDISSPRSVLSFWHTFEFESWGYDGAVLEISTDDGQTWVDLGSKAMQGGYNGKLPGANPLGPRMAWLEGTFGPMVQVTVDLTGFEGAGRKVRFRFASDTSDAGIGWYIDDVEIYSFLPCGDVTPTPTPTDTPTPTFTPTPVSGDQNLNLFMFSSFWDTPVNETNYVYDFDQSGQIDAKDLLEFVKRWPSRNDGPNEIVINIPGLAAGAKPLTLVRIPSGSFQMGSPDTERRRWSAEGPVHTVHIGYDFYMGKWEVTQAQWQALMGSNPASGSGNGEGDDYPVYYVSWDDIQGSN